MKVESLFLLSKHRIDYQFRDQDGPLIIFLHGYAQNSKSFFDEIKSIIPENCATLFPNGPFPMPGQTRTIDNLGHAWYFYDSINDQYYIPYSISSELIKSLIENLKLEQREKIIVGFSQGGYLAPFVAEELSFVRHVVCINSSSRYEYMKKTDHDFLVHAINGADDNMVDPSLARERHEKLSSLNRQGEFTLLPNTGHRINSAILSKLKDYLP